MTSKNCETVFKTGEFYKHKKLNSGTAIVRKTMNKCQNSLKLKATYYRLRSFSNLTIQYVLHCRH